MREFVKGFTAQLKEAIEIGKNFSPKNKDDFENILICGLGGSGIGGGIARDLVIDECTVPIVLVNGYNIPSYVSNKTLCIASSYSGNTEETLEAVSKAEAKGATIAAITSGGQLQKICESKGYDHIIVPGGMPPRAALGYSLTQQLYILHAFGFTSDKTLKELENSAPFLEELQGDIQDLALETAKKIYTKLPVIYTEDGIGATAIRWRQQLNENSKMLLWHHYIPEMNHNELVGWAAPHPDVVPIFISTDYDHPRAIMRRDLNMKVIEKYSDTPILIKATGSNKTEQVMYLINLGDWISVDAADLRQVDAMDITVINNLKSELSKK